MMQIEAKHLFPERAKHLITKLNLNKEGVINKEGFNKAKSILETTTFWHNDQKGGIESFLPIITPKFPEYKSTQLDFILSSISGIVLKGEYAYYGKRFDTPSIILNHSPVLVLPTFVLIPGRQEDYYPFTLTLTTKELIRESVLISLNNDGDLKSTSITDDYLEKLGQLDEREAILVKGPTCEWIKGLREISQSHNTNQVDLFEPCVRTLEMFCIQNNFTCKGQQLNERIQLPYNILESLFEFL